MQTLSPVSRNARSHIMSPLSPCALFLLLAFVSCQESRRGAVRGFRLGAADRFSHGFGKRAGGQVENDISQQRISPRISVNALARVLSQDVRISHDFIKHYIDKNGDGYVTDDELSAASTSF